MKAILPAAGYATRLYPLTLDIPKALLLINGKPLIEYIIEKILKLEDINEIIIVTNDRFYHSFVKWGSSFKSTVPIKIINDKTKNNEERLGTVGDIDFVLKKEKITEDIVIINSDNLFSFDLKEIYDYFKEKRNVVGLFDVGHLDISRKMGNPVMDKYNRITYFKEKDKNTNSTVCAIGIYFFSSESISLIDDYLCAGNSPDRSGDFIEWFYNKLDIYGYIFDNSGDYWFDIGSKEDYDKAVSLLGE
ncbi:MAG: nucleotidyltransferase family protein [Nanoarchaeota archaeon]|nr:nucleotidyltransferase family protein [Nanoarchaeota archaeon]